MSTFVYVCEGIENIRSFLNIPSYMLRITVLWKFYPHFFHLASTSIECIYDMYMARNHTLTNTYIHSYLFIYGTGYSRLIVKVAKLFDATGLITSSVGEWTLNSCCGNVTNNGIGYFDARHTENDRPFSIYS